MEAKLNKTQNRKIAEKKKSEDVKAGDVRIKKKNQNIIVNIGKRGGEKKKAIYKEDLKKKKGEEEEIK